MIVHLCIHCGRISCNRIAGDDNTFSIEQLLQCSESTSTELNRITSSGIILLTENDSKLVKTYLYGY